MVDESGIVGRNWVEKLEKIRRTHKIPRIFGPSVEIRTRGLLNPIQARYQTSPHPDVLVI